MRVFVFDNRMATGKLKEFWTFFLVMIFLDLFSGQTLNPVSETCSGPNEKDILMKELNVLHQIVRDQVIKMEVLKGELSSLKEKLSKCK